MTDPWYDNASVIRTALTRLLEKRAGDTREIADLMQRLDRLEGLYRDAIGRGPAAGVRLDRNKPRYRRRHKQGQWYLAEARLSGGPDMLVPREDHDHLAAILQTTKRAMSVEDLREALARKLHLDGEVPDYRVRVVIRYWLSLDPPPVEKVSTAYRPVEPKKFKARVAEAFDALPEG